MPTRLTKQGIRALDPVGHNGHRGTRTRCAHNFAGPSEIIGTRWVLAEDDYIERKEPIYGHRCLFGCGEIRQDP